MDELLSQLNHLHDKAAETYYLLGLDKSQAELERLQQQMSAPDFWSDQEAAAAVGRQYEAVKKELDVWQALRQDIDDALEMAKLVKESGQDGVDETELKAKLKELEDIYAKMEFSVLFAGQYDKGDAVVSIHAGTGGVDAMDWAQMLLRMYLRFCERHGLEAKIADETPGAEAGLKSAVITVSGRYAYGWLKSENGVHRLVRISPFDAEKMRHTSFALVEVLPQIEEVKHLEIKDDDLKIEVMRAGGHGGQSVNTTDSAVRITHLPTGLNVKCQNERSQLQNKNNALKILKAKLLKYYEQEEDEKVQKMKGEYRKAEWGNQARSYVLQPYKLVKDHRTEHETPDTDRVLNGEFDDFVESYLRSKIK